MDPAQLLTAFLFVALATSDPIVHRRGAERRHESDNGRRRPTHDSIHFPGRFRAEDESSGPQTSVDDARRGPEARTTPFVRSSIVYTAITHDVTRGDRRAPPALPPSPPPSEPESEHRQQMTAAQRDLESNRPTEDAKIAAPIQQPSTASRTRTFRHDDHRRRHHHHRHAEPRKRQKTHYASATGHDRFRGATHDDDQYRVIPTPNSNVHHPTERQKDGRRNPEQTAKTIIGEERYPRREQDGGRNADAEVRHGPTPRFNDGEIRRDLNVQRRPPTFGRDEYAVRRPHPQTLRNSRVPPPLPPNEPFRLTGSGDDVMDARPYVMHEGERIEMIELRDYPDSGFDRETPGSNPPRHPHPPAATANPEDTRFALPGGPYARVVVVRPPDEAVRHPGGPPMSIDVENRYEHVAHRPSSRQEARRSRPRVKDADEAGRRANHVPLDQRAITARPQVMPDARDREHYGSVREHPVLATRAQHGRRRQFQRDEDVVNHEESVGRPQRQAAFPAAEEPGIGSYLEELVFPVIDDYYPIMTAPSPREMAPLDRDDEAEQGGKMAAAETSAERSVNAAAFAENKECSSYRKPA